MSDVAKVANMNVLEVSVSVNEVTKSRMSPGDVEPASVEIFMIRDDEKLGEQRFDYPEVLGRLVAGQVIWFAERDTPARETFRLESRNFGKDIPDWLPDEIRFHVLISSQATFEFLRNEA